MTRLQHHKEAANIANERANTRDPYNWVDCEECRGEGVIWQPWPRDYRCEVCPECDGSGGYEWLCETCLNTVQVDGYDCIVCETVWCLPDSLFDAEKRAKIGKAWASVLTISVEDKS